MKTEDLIKLYDNRALPHVGPSGDLRYYSDKVTNNATICNALSLSNIDISLRRIAASLENCEKVKQLDAALGKAEGEIERLNKELKNIINTECNHCGDCAKFGKDCNAGDVDGAEDNQACEKFISKDVAELRECLREAVTEVCNRLEKCGFKDPCVFKTCYVQKWRKVLEGATK